jgi:hypothetical protein
MSSSSRFTSIDVSDDDQVDLLLILTHFV